MGSVIFLHNGIISLISVTAFANMVKRKRFTMILIEKAGFFAIDDIKIITVIIMITL